MSAATGCDSPTSRWLAAAPHMPPLEGPPGTAERLLLLLHYGIDWQDSWIARRRAGYWDRILPDRVIAATYRAPNLRRWWQDVAAETTSRPRTAGERAELEALLREPPGPVLDVMRWEAEALLLRTRIIADAVRERRARQSQEQE
jgi:hypothetical protein